MWLKKRSFFLVCLAALTALGLLSSTLAFAEEKAEKPAVADKPAVAEKADPFAVPEGTPAELTEHLDQLMTLRPEGKTLKERLEYTRKQAKTIVKVADKILASTEATPAEQKNAAAKKFLVLRFLVMRLRDKEAIEAIGKLPEELTKLGLTDLAEMAETMRLQIDLGKALAGKPGAPSLEKIIETIKQKVAGKPDKKNIGLISMVVKGIQEKQSVEKALALCDEFAGLYAKDQSKDAANMVRRIKGIARRMQLLGNSMEISGTLLGGEPLDWNAYKGKVVLVDFSAAWCAPCRGEIPNVKKYYDLYHDRGFDVVSISLDKNREAAEKYVKENNLPWAMVFEDGEENAAWNTPMAIDYAVNAIPAMFLLNQEGKVVSERARGPVLGKELERLLGPAKPEKSEDDKPKE